MINNVKPAAVHTAFNPAIFSFKREANSNETKAVIYVENLLDDENSVELTGEFFNGMAHFDLSNIIKNYFIDNAVEVMHPVIVDMNIMTGYNVTNKNNQQHLGQFYALNAVAQLGESSDLTKKKGTFCTNFERLYVFEGYERTVGCIGYYYDLEKNTHVNFNGSPMNGSELPAFLIQVKPGIKYVGISNKIVASPLETNGGDIIRNGRGEIIYVSINKDYEERRIPVDTCSVPDSPFYVRWINQQGGWDFWMFAHRQFINRNIQNTQTFKPYISNQETAAATILPLYTEGVEKIKVGAEGVSNNEFEVISRLIYSPSIQWYNEQTKKWVNILVDSGENERDTRSSLQNIEFTFTMPEPQLQF